MLVHQYNMQPICKQPSYTAILYTSQQLYTLQLLYKWRQLYISQ